MNEVDILKYIQENESINNQDTSLFWTYVFTKLPVSSSDGSKSWPDVFTVTVLICVPWYREQQVWIVEARHHVFKTVQLWYNVALDFQDFTGNVDKDLALQIVYYYFSINIVQFQPVSPDWKW